jgi:hypothetical protein
MNDGSGTGFAVDYPDNVNGFARPNLAQIHPARALFVPLERGTLGGATELS